MNNITYSSLTELLELLEFDLLLSLALLFGELPGLSLTGVLNSPSKVGI